MKLRAESGEFFGRDNYALWATGRWHRIGTSMADDGIYVGVRGLAATVIPSIDEEALMIESDRPEEAERAAEVLLGHNAIELWREPGLAMELGSYVGHLARDGELYLRLRFAAAEDGKILPVEVRSVAPETMRRRGDHFEQFAHRRAHEGAGYVVSGEPRDLLAEISAQEIVHLRWPLSAHVGCAPGELALRAGVEEERQAHRGLMIGRAGAEPKDTFWPIARAKAGAYADALERRQIAAEQVRDYFLYAGTFESEWFSWLDESTEYFACERAISARIEICRLREYLLDGFNQQFLARWSRMNNWAPIRLRLRCELFSEEDWRQMQVELEEGKLSMPDIRAAMHAEHADAHSFGRFAG